MTRRVDRLEFLDLTTVHRTITLTLDLDSFSIPQPRYVPLALFRRGAGRAGITVRDGQSVLVPFISNVKSDALVQQALQARLTELKAVVPDEMLREISEHAPERCAALESAAYGAHGFDGYADLASEKWGCPQVGKILAQLERLRGPDAKTAEVVRALFDWQNNTVLLLGPLREDEPVPTAWSTLTIAYDEEVGEWQPPWERRRSALARTPAARAKDLEESKDLLREISRGGPFAPDLNALLPERRLRGRLARSANPLARRIGRAGLLGQTLHVGWEQTTGGDVQRHHIEVAVPPELLVVRIRRLAEEPKANPARRTTDKGMYELRDHTVVPADETGVRAHVIAPRSKVEGTAVVPAFLSVLIAARNEDLWISGAALAAATAVVLSIVSLLSLIGITAPLERVVEQTEATVTVLLVAPTLIATFLSIQATSSIASALTSRLRPLLVAVAALALTTGVSLILVVPPEPAPLPALLAEDQDPPWSLRITWSIVAALIATVAGALTYGAVRARQLRRAGDGRERNRDVPRSPPRRLKVLEDKKVPTPPPNKWIDSGEGDRDPWGWLVAPDEPQGRPEDQRYWQAVLGREWMAIRAEIEALRVWRARLADDAEIRATVERDEPHTEQ